MTRETPASPDSMNCDELVTLATAYLDQVLDLETRARFDLHRVECGGCENYLQQLLCTIDTLGRVADDDTVDPAFRERLLAAFRNRQ